MPIYGGSTSFCFYKVLDSFLGLKKLENKCDFLVYLPLSSLILNLDLMQSFHLKENTWLSYFASGSPISPSGANDVPEFLVLKREVIMKTDQCQLIAILPNP